MTLDFTLVSALSIFAPTVVGAIFYNRLWTISKSLYFLVLSTLVVEVVARLLFEYRINNMFIFLIHPLIEVGFLASIYYRLSNSVRWSFVIVTSATLFFLISALSVLLYHDISEFNSVQRYFQFMLIATMSIAYLIDYIRLDHKNKYRTSPFVLLSIGLLVYFCGTFYFFAFGGDLLSTSKSYWVIHGIFNILLNTIYTLVLWKAKVQP